MVLLVVALVGATALVIGTVSYERARRALASAARARLVLLARDIAEHLHGELEDRAADITNWAHLEVMRAMLYDDVDKELAQFLQQSFEGGRVYRAIGCYAGAERPVAGVGEVESLAPHSRPSETRLVVVPLKERVEKLLQIETPIFNPQRPEDAIGTLVVLLDPSRIIDIPSATAQGITLSLRTRTGETILDPDASTNDPGATAASVKALAAVGQVIGVGGPPLEVQVSEPASVALADVYGLRATLLHFGLIVLLISAALGALVAWRISSPIRQLTATVRDIAKSGHLEPNAAFPHAGGEVGVLSSAFRAMMESLAAAQREALAQARLAFLGEIAANIAHEVRTPLAVLKTAAHLLARGEIPLEEQRDLARTTAVEVDRLNTVVTSLVDLARQKPVRQQLEPVGPIVERAVVFFQPLARRQGVDIHHETVPPDLFVHGSADQLHQVLLNLIHNAIQAMAGPGILTVSCGREDGSVVVEVDDSGPGFSSEALARAFSPFYTTKPDGSGLGLAIAKRIVEEHGGTMTASNRPEGGARVWFRLPAREAPR
jgi:two-component system sensor histidine kinase HydH